MHFKEVEDFCPFFVGTSKIIHKGNKHLFELPCKKISREFTYSLNAFAVHKTISICQTKPQLPVFILAGLDSIDTNKLDELESNLLDAEQSLIDANLDER